MYADKSTKPRKGKDAGIGKKKTHREYSLFQTRLKKKCREREFLNAMHPLADVCNLW
jgi:hypothetical protein